MLPTYSRSSWLVSQPGLGQQEVPSWDFKTAWIADVWCCAPWPTCLSWGGPRTGHQGQGTGLTDFSSKNPMFNRGCLKKTKVYQSLSVLFFSSLSSQMSNYVSDPSSPPSASGLFRPTDPSPKISNQERYSAWWFQPHESSQLIIPSMLEKS